MLTMVFSTLDLVEVAHEASGDRWNRFFVKVWQYKLFYWALHVDDLTVVSLTAFQSGFMLYLRLVLG